MKYVFGLSEGEKGSSWKQKQHKKYHHIFYKFINVRRNIDFDIRHGVTREEVAKFLNKVGHDSSFSKQRKIVGSIERIKELEVEKG